MDPVEARFRAAVDRQRTGDYVDAVRLYREVLSLQPGLPIAEENLCLALLGAGDYAEGFARYDIRFDRTQRRVEKPRLSFPEWRGEPLAGRSILVWMEQGFGDQIMFARFVESLAVRGAAVSLLAPPPLAGLFRALPAQVIEASGSVSIPPHDFWIMPASIPRWLGVTLETLPRSPYLPVTPARPGAGVGVAWHGDPRHPLNETRSLSPQHRDRLLALPGARSLHPEDTGARDFQETAEIIAGLAQVITVDTSVAHLAGAMGKPALVLLSARNCCWRWMSGRSDSPWYPSLRLLRQSTPDDWAPVVEAAIHLAQVERA